MAFHRRIDGSEAIAREAAAQHELRRSVRSSRLGVGTLACPLCDAPVAIAGGPLSPADTVACPYCRHSAALRDFLSLAEPSRPARVEVRVVERVRPAQPPASTTS